MKKGSSSLWWIKMHEYKFAFHAVPIFLNAYMFKYTGQMISCHSPNLKPIYYITVCQNYSLYGVYYTFSKIQVQGIIHYNEIVMQTINNIDMTNYISFWPSDDWATQRVDHPVNDDYIPSLNEYKTCCLSNEVIGSLEIMMHAKQNFLICNFSITYSTEVYTLQNLKFRINCFCWYFFKMLQLDVLYHYNIDFT